MNSKLVINFITDTGKNARFVYAYADKDAEKNDIKALVNGIIANGSIFQNVPIAVQSVQIISTNTTNIDISD